MAKTKTAAASSHTAAIKSLMQARVGLAEKLANQLGAWENTKAERAKLDEQIATEAAAARDIWDECLAGGWTAKELNSAGLKPPAAPRAPRGSGSGDEAGNREPA
ncbi:hypothetical protein SAMN05892883_2223 [Jatrophihabitans sp. GAS493]|uniref:hypothetical protein n=1 Tax=Jatrophihabitans sp. GAS493 TaxID=1907575 RepID=UPI000BC08E23|nr:hypothetical protein [Jatrophihabitans sp. GAS493]SOD72907.1 hypothetical protein SAMN05892883_2223 [Jatrophihabitans sp. GAS493]